MPSICLNMIVRNEVANNPTGHGPRAAIDVRT